MTASEAQQALRDAGFGTPFFAIPCKLDECSRWRHFFARLGLVKHRTRTVTMVQLQVEINQRLSERMDALLERGR